MGDVEGALRGQDFWSHPCQEGAHVYLLCALQSRWMEELKLKLKPGARAHRAGPASMLRPLLICLFGLLWYIQALIASLCLLGPLPAARGS